MRLAILCSRAVSLMNVAKDIAYVAKRRGITPVLLDYAANPYDVERMADAAIVVMTFNPLMSRTWFLISRDLNKMGIPSFVYTTTEGRLPLRHIREWMRREIVWVANSNYTRDKLQEAGIPVTDVVHHGINLDEVALALKYRTMFRRDIESKLGKGVIFGIVASSHPRKGLQRFVQVIKLVRERCKDAKFYIVTTPTATTIFAGVEGVYIDTNFGKRGKAETLGLISAFDFYVQPSLAEGFCLPPGSPVITIDGIKPIEEVKEGDLVLTHEGRFRKVIKTTRRHHKGKIIRLVVWNNRAFELRLTPEHPVLAIRRPKKKWRKSMGQILAEGGVDIEWIPASELRKGDIVLFPIPNQMFRVDVIDLHEVLEREGIEHEFDDNYVWLRHGYSPITDVSYSKIAEVAGVDIDVVKYVFEELLPRGKEPRTDEHRKVIDVAIKLGYIKPEPKKYPRFIRDIKKLARLLGYYTAEGSISASGYAVELSFGGDEEDLVNDVARIVKELFNDDVRIYRRKNKNVIQVVLCGVPYVALVKQCGVGAHNKRIPPWILYGDIETLKEFIDAYLKGDGSIVRVASKNKVSTRIVATTVSLQLAVDLKVAMVRLGYKPSVRVNKRKDGRIDYEVVVFEDNRGVTHSNKAWFIGSKYIGFLIDEVIEEEYDGMVYNLEVDEDNSYTTPVCVIHNCLPVLEAMALGVPAIHVAYEPITEFSDPRANIWVPYETVVTNSFGEGIEYELHIYSPQEFACAILDAVDMIRNRRSEYEDRKARAMEKAMEFDIMRLYPRLLDIVSRVDVAIA